MSELSDAAGSRRISPESSDGEEMEFDTEDLRALRDKLHSIGILPYF